MGFEVVSWDLLLMILGSRHSEYWGMENGAGPATCVKIREGEGRACDSSSLFALQQFLRKECEGEGGSFRAGREVPGGCRRPGRQGGA